MARQCVRRARACPTHTANRDQLGAADAATLRADQPATFLSRRHLGATAIGAVLRQVPVKETTMRRVLKVMHRKDAYLPPAARRLLTLVRKSGRMPLEET